MAAGRFLLYRRAAESRGRRSELLAAMFLLLKGYRILGRRVRTRAGEIDLIARSPRGIVCFVEVKARNRRAALEDALGPRQRLRIGRAALLYLAARPGLGARGVRFDLVTLVKGGFPRHIRDAWRGEAG